MTKVAIMTDSNSGISMEQAKEMGCFMLNMPIIIDQKTYIENEDIDTDFFYDSQSKDANVTSSQPSIASVMGMWDEILKEYDEIVYIPMTSALSGSCQSAIVFSEEYNGKVQVVDNHRISVTQMLSVQDALYLKDKGYDAKQIKEILEQEAYDASIYITVDTLKYLEKGGRITPSVALLGSMLKIKPVLTIQGEKLDTCAKARGMKSAFKTMIEHLKEDYETRFKEYAQKGELAVGLAYTQMSEEDVAKWAEKLHEEFPGLPLYKAPLTMSIGCHIGPGGLGTGLIRIHKE
ncbi:DegV family protein [Floccifex sp.]|uniref:DegV family protein n=1 Tax=Floccifex sp. TaxID=2815810 RepID=UPI003F0B6F0E